MMALLAALSPAQILVFGSLTLLSLADLRMRTLPGIWIFFFAAFVFGVSAAPWKALTVLAAVGWGSVPRLPAWGALPAVFYPPIWPVLLTAAGARKKLIAKGDLLALGGIAFLTDWYGPLLALLCVMLWRRLWKVREPGAAPAVPGLLLGVAAGTVIEML